MVNACELAATSRNGSWNATGFLKISSRNRRARWPWLAGRCPTASSKGGRLLAFGRGPYATDAQHVSVEFVHPIIVGKRALPALDLSLLFRPWLDAILQPEDIVMGFGPPGRRSQKSRTRSPPRTSAEP